MIDNLAEQRILQQVADLLTRQKRVENLVHRQARDGTRHQLVEGLVHQQHLAELRSKLGPLSVHAIARLMEALPPDDSLLVWNLVSQDRGTEILERLSDALRETLLETSPLDTTGQSPHDATTSIHVFEHRDEQLKHVHINSRDALTATQPIWIDLLAPSKEARQWIQEIFGLRLPDPENLTDLEESARFYIDENSETHLHSNFLLDRKSESRNVAVAFILHQNILFSVRNEELPVFRQQRLRARIQPGYVTDGMDVLLALYDADIEYSAETLETLYAQLEGVGKRVLSPHISDDEAAEILAGIAKGEDLNGRIRRNVLDTRRALSFLMRSRSLKQDQQEDTRQILRDIESLDGHTSFLFGKINFLMDATVGFININQNKRVSRLTTVGVVFTPINIIAGIGGMSEFSMMTEGIPWPLAYGAFALGIIIIGLGAYRALRYFEQRKWHRPETATHPKGG